MTPNEDRRRHGGCRRKRALEEGVWGRNLAKVSPQLARPHKTLTKNSRNTQPCGSPALVIN